jgi:hypothetical protein
MAKAEKMVFCVMVEGWGDREDVYYECGTFSTRDKAEQAMEKLLEGWEADGGTRDEVSWIIEGFPVDAVPSAMEADFI